MLLGATDGQSLDAGAAASSAVLASADFLNDVYNYGGSSVALSSIIVETSNRSASGLIIQPSSTIIGNYLTLLNTLNWTIIATFIPNSGVFNSNIQASFISGTRSAHNDIYQAYIFEGIGGFFEENAAATSQFTDDTHPVTAATINKIAWTRTNSHQAISTNGNAVVVNNSPLTIITDGFIFCPADASSLGFLHKFEILSVQSDAVLPSLST